VVSRFDQGLRIVLRSSKDPRPGSKEVLMRVRASSLNYRDLMVVKGGGRGPTKVGVVALSDGAGEVAAIGDGVTRSKPGDRVIGTFHPRWFGGPLSVDYLTGRLGANLDGMLAEYAVLSEEAIVPVPSHLSFEEAATLPCAAVTAWVALTGHRRVTAGDTVLTQGSGAFRPLLYSLPGLGRPSDRDNLNRGKSREAQGIGGFRGYQLCRDAGLG
jgi:NADPH:quinone reductase-like Zn-dependent oxidoreductase